MKIAAKHIWDVIRHLTEELRSGKRWFFWDGKKEFYCPEDFHCFKTSRLSDVAFRNSNMISVMPIDMLLQCLQRKLSLNSLYPLCIHVDIVFIYHLYSKEHVPP